MFVDIGFAAFFLFRYVLLIYSLSCTFSMLCYMYMMSILGFNEIMDQLAMASSVYWYGLC